MGAELDYDSSSDPHVVPNKKGIEKRRETSRYAARDRRGKEADVFVDLKEVVPLVEESTVTHVDRIALLRVAATLCRMRKNVNKFFEQSRSVFHRAAEDEDEFVEEPKQEVGIWTENSLTECLDGFVLIAASDGSVLYVTESVSVFLGLTQEHAPEKRFYREMDIYNSALGAWFLETDFIGRYLKDFIHQHDYDELGKAIIGSEAGKDSDCGLVLRMKSVISPRGRNLNFKSALYKAVVCKCRFIANAGAGGRITLIHGCSNPAGQGNQPGAALNSSIARGNEAASSTYMTRHTCDMKFTYVSDSLNYLLCHSTKSLMGTSFYDLVHPGDLFTLTNSMKELFCKGYCRTNFYRLLGTNSSVVWSQTEATTVNHTTRGRKGQYVLCVHSILGMQSEADSWCPLNCTPANSSSANGTLGAQAAHPVKRNVKCEIVDAAEYFGRQPEFIDCVDFTPLIEPMTVSATMNPQSINQAARNQIQRANYQDETDFAEPIADGKTLNSFHGWVEYLTDDDEYDVEVQQQPRTRKSSYEAVLQWLFRYEEEEEKEESFGMENAQPHEKYAVQEDGISYPRTDGQSQLQNQVYCESTTTQKGCCQTRDQQPTQNSSGISRSAGYGRDFTTVPRTRASVMGNGSYPLFRGRKHPRSTSHSDCVRESSSKIQQRAYSNVRESDKFSTSCSPAREQSLRSGKKAGAETDGAQKRYSRYKKDVQHVAELAYYHQRNDGMRERPKQHYGPSVSTVSECSSYPVPTNHGSSSSLQSSMSAANHKIPAKFSATQQPPFSSSSQQFGVSPVAVVAPFNVNQLSTASTNNLHQSLCQQQQQCPDQQNAQQLECTRNSGSQYDQQEKLASSDFDNLQQEDDLSKSYKECEQLGAQLAPFLPQEEMFELCDDISLLPMDIEGLFPEFDTSNFLFTSMPPQKIVAEFEQPTEGPTKKARLDTVLDFQDRRPLLE